MTGSVATSQDRRRVGGDLMGGRSDAESRSHHLRRGGTGRHWYVEVDANEVWIAVPQSAGGGGGWFRQECADPQLFKWDEVDPSDVLDYALDDRDQVVALTVEMLVSCLNDGFGEQAAQIAGALIAHGYGFDISVHSRH